MTDNSSSKQSTKQRFNSLPNLALPLGILVVVLCGLSFWGGVAYNKAHSSNSTAAAAGSGFGSRSGFAGRFGGQRPIFGQVTSISPTSISLSNSRTGATSTLTITSTTQITDNGQSVATTAIQTGDQVIVQLSTSNSTQASRIILNPSFAGGNSPAAAGSGSSGLTN